VEGFREHYETEKSKYEKVVSELKTRLLSSEAYSSQLNKLNTKLVEDKVRFTSLLFFLLFYDIIYLISLCDVL